MRMKSIINEKLFYSYLKGLNTYSDSLSFPIRLLSLNHFCFVFRFSVHMI